jgi:aminopeptidase-like protein
MDALPSHLGQEAAGRGRLFAHLDPSEAGARIYALASVLFPLGRSLTGDGVRETLRILKRYIELDVHEVPSGTAVFDWVIPPEWTLRSASIKTAAGETVVDYVNNNLHIVGYSRPVRARMTRAELQNHVFTLPDQPDLIPYRTSYYADTWGFCLSHRQWLAMDDGPYDVLIDASLDPGALTYGEYLHRGTTTEDVLVSAHICHPSLANDNCSGLALATVLAAALKGRTTRYSYRFLFAPGTIGAITWLARNEPAAQRIKHGLVLSCVGDPGGPTYKKSRLGTALIDRAMAHVLRHAAPHAAILDFSPYGYDERQYCSPGFNLPVGSFQRSQYGTFPEYHTSGDNLDFIQPECLGASLSMIAGAIDIVEHDAVFLNVLPKCEPQLGRRGLYAAIGGDKTAPSKNMAMLWVLNLCDGAHSLLDIADRAGLPFAVIYDTAAVLREHGLLSPAGSPKAGM